MAQTTPLHTTIQQHSKSRAYGELVVYTVTLILLVVAIFFVVFLSLREEKPDNSMIAIMGQQKMLCERIAKSAVSVRLKMTEGSPAAETVSELSDAYSRITEVIAAFDKGGTINDANDQSLTIEPFNDSEIKQAISEIKVRWRGYKDIIDFFKLQASRSGTVKIVGSDSLFLAQIVEVALFNNKPLLRATDAISYRLQVLALDRTRRFQLIQFSLASLAILLFIVAIVRTAISLRMQDEIIADQIQELEGSKGQLTQYSQELEKMVAARTRELEISKDRLAEYSVGLEKMVDSRTRELRESQASLIQSEKMASLGQMVAGLAHEINTPLGYVRNNVVNLMELQAELYLLASRFMDTQKLLLSGDFDDLERTIAENETALQSISPEVYKQAEVLFDESIEGLDQIKELALNLKNFSRLDEAQTKETDIHKGIDATLRIAHNMLKHRVTIEKNYGDLPLVKCYPAQLNQVLLNLITNAAQACEKPGDDAYRGRIFIQTRPARDHIVIDIADNGKGIKPEHLNRIFEPFFTTKPIGQGTGLGLSIVYKIIEQHNGKISVKSEVNVGTVFTIELPLDARSPQKQNGAGAGGGSDLLIDDGHAIGAVAVKNNVF